ALPPAEPMIMIRSRNALLAVLLLACGCGKVSVSTVTPTDPRAVKENEKEAPAEKSAHGENWTHWRGPEQTGVSRDHGLPDDWDPAKGTNVVWKADIGGRSTPIIQNGRVY